MSDQHGYSLNINRLGGGGGIGLNADGGPGAMGGPSVWSERGGNHNPSSSLRGISMNGGVGNSEIRHTEQLSSDIGSLYLNDDYADVTLLFDGEVQFRAHKVILAARSSYFRALLFGGMRETSLNEIELKDTNGSGFRVLLRYIYTGCLSLASMEEETLLEVLGLAHRYGFDELQTDICDYLSSSLTVDNVSTIFGASHLYFLSDLRSCCLDFMDRRALEVLKTDGFANLSQGAIEQIITRDSFCAPEIEIFYAIKHWMELQQQQHQSPPGLISPMPPISRASPARSSTPCKNRQGLPVHSFHRNMTSAISEKLQSASSVNRSGFLLPPSGGCQKAGSAPASISGLSSSGGRLRNTNQTTAPSQLSSQKGSKSGTSSSASSLCIGSSLPWCSSSTSDAFSSVGQGLIYSRIEGGVTPSSQSISKSSHNSSVGGDFSDTAKAGSNNCNVYGTTIDDYDNYDQLQFLSRKLSDNCTNSSVTTCSAPLDDLEESGQLASNSSQNGDAQEMGEMDSAGNDVSCGNEMVCDDVASSLNNYANEQDTSAEPEGRESTDFTRIFNHVRLPLIGLNDLLNVVRPTGLIPADAILDAIREQTQKRDMDLHYRGCLVPDVNVATPGHGAQVMEGELRQALLNGDHTTYDMERGFTRHPIEESTRGIVVQLGTQCIINHIRLLLWDKDQRSYSYTAEVSMNQTDWVVVADYSHFYCRSWQNIHFSPKVVKYIRVIGKRNTVNRVFHLVHLEAFYSSETVELAKQSVIIPRENKACENMGACVLEGVSRTRNALLNGETESYDWDTGYTCHQLGNGAIVVQLSQPYVVDSMRILLWDCDDRSYSYYVETSLDQQIWTVIADHRADACQSWQNIRCTPHPVSFIRIVGTHNTANEVFHCVHFECPSPFVRDMSPTRAPPLSSTPSTISSALVTFPIEDLQRRSSSPPQEDNRGYLVGGLPPVG